MKPANPFQVASLALLLSVSCGYDNVSSTVINGPATVTVVAPDVNFGNFKTFSIVDAVTQVTQSGSSAPTFTCDSSTTSQQILAAVTQNMTSRGFTQGPTITCQGTNPPPASDLAINVSVMKLTNTSINYYPCYWWGYWGYPSYGCYYPYYWVSSYSTGTEVTQISDLKNAPPDGGSIEDLWGALGYSVLSGTNGTNSAAAVSSINQAFAQSPYLKTP
jgi:hypothetical protein